MSRLNANRTALPLRGTVAGLHQSPVDMEECCEEKNLIAWHWQLTGNIPRYSARALVVAICSRCAANQQEENEEPSIFQDRITHCVENPLRPRSLGQKYPFRRIMKYSLALQRRSERKSIVNPPEKIFTQSGVHPLTDPIQPLSFLSSARGNSISHSRHVSAVGRRHIQPHGVISRLCFQRVGLLAQAHTLYRCQLSNTSYCSPHLRRHPAQNLDMSARHIPFVLLPLALCSLVTARLHHSLVPEDPYAFPKYRVTFLNGLPVLNETAQSWLQNGLRGGELEFLDQPWEGDLWGSPPLKSIEGGSQQDVARPVQVRTHVSVNICHASLLMSTRVISLHLLVPKNSSSK